MENYDGVLARRLAGLNERGLRRRLPGPRAGVDFWSNDYLGLGRIRGGVQPAAGGATGSRLISGDREEIHALERRIADYHGAEAALLFGSGYLANLGLLSALGRRTDTFLYDELIHASCHDGMRLSLAKRRKFRHNDTEDLERWLGAGRADGQRFVLTEGRFSMDGDRADLKALLEACERHGAGLIVDEAHAFGVDGNGGRGLAHGLLRHGAVLARVITYGKAGGYHGAAVLGSSLLKEYLVNTARPLVYSTAVDLSFVAGVGRVYDLLTARFSELRGGLERVIQGYEERAAADGLGYDNGPIQTIKLADNQRVMQSEQACLDAGLLVKGIRSPTVAAGSERLRICLHAFNTEVELDRLFAVLKTMV